jgi:ABC-type transporter Mla subunit MlaD
MRLEKDDAKVGLLVLLTLGLFVGFILHRGMTRLLRRVARIQVRLENAADVATGTEVQLQGLRVGQVDEVHLRRDGVQYHFLAQLGLRPDIVLWEGTRVVVVSKPLGGAFLDLQLPPPERRDELLKADTVLPASASPSLGTLVDAITALVANLDRGVDELRGEFKTRGLGALLEHPNVARPLRSLDRSLQSVDRLAGDSRRLVQRGETAVASLDRALVDLQGNLAQVRDLLDGRGDDLDAVAASLGSTLKEIEGLARELRAQVAQAGPDTDAGLKSLDRTLRAAEELLELLKNKPSRVIWGKPSQKEKDAARERAEAARKAQGAGSLSK